MQRPPKLSPIPKVSSNYTKRPQLLNSNLLHITQSRGFKVKSSKITQTGKNRPEGIWLRSLKIDPSKPPLNLSNYQNAQPTLFWSPASPFASPKLLENRDILFKKPFKIKIIYLLDKSIKSPNYKNYLPFQSTTKWFRKIEKSNFT